MSVGKRRDGFAQAVFGLGEERNENGHCRDPWAGFCPGEDCRGPLKKDGVFSDIL